MPFTASLGNDRWRNGLAPCAPLIPKGFWDSQPWELRKEYCRVCPYRFAHRPSCSVDFMSVGETDQFKTELALALAWISDHDADWSDMEMAVNEVDFAYYYIGLETPSPMKVMASFIESCANVQPDEKFWKDWNYRGVEQLDGKPALKLQITGPMKSDVNKIALNVIEPQTYSGKRLLHLYAAAAVLEDLSVFMRLKTLERICGSLVETCRRAVMANSTVEIS